jgi:hypothetical protein
MGSITSQQPVLSDSDINQFLKGYESYHLFILPLELFTRVLDFLDKRSIIMAFSKACKYCRAFCSKNGYDNLLMFCREGQRPQDLTYSRTIRDMIRRPRLIANPRLSSQKAPMPSDISVRVFINEHLKQFLSSDIVSMIVERSDGKNSSEKTSNASNQAGAPKKTLNISDRADVSKGVIDMTNQADPSDEAFNASNQADLLKTTSDLSNQADTSEAALDSSHQKDPSKIALDKVSNFINPLFVRDLSSLKILKLSGLPMNKDIASNLGQLNLILLDIQDCYNIGELFCSKHPLRSRAVLLEISGSSFEKDPNLLFGECLEALSIHASDSFFQKDFIMDASQCCKLNMM